MFELWKIVEENRATFYDYSTNVRHNLWRSRIVKFLTAAVASFLFSKMSEQFLGAVLTVYSILIGFSFNVLFQLISFDGVRKAAGQSLETEAKLDRLQMLSNELFYNVSYFNVISIILVIFTLCYFLVYLPQPSAVYALAQSIISVSERVQEWFTCTMAVGKFMIRVGFYFLLFESVYSFLRTISRLSHFFKLKMDLQKTG